MMDTKYLDMIDDAKQEQIDLKEELIRRQMDRIRDAKERNCRDTLWLGDEARYRAVADEVKRMFASKGYKIVRTGYIGGVWQLSYDICW